MIKDHLEWQMLGERYEPLQDESVRGIQCWNPWQRCLDRVSRHTIRGRRNVGCSKACSLQSMIRTTYPDRICYCPSVMFTSVVCFSLRESGQESAPHVLLGNPDGVDPDSLARFVSSGRGVPTPCTQTVPLATQLIPPGGRILSGRSSTFSGYFTSRYLTAGWKRRTFQLPRLDTSGSSDSAYLESFSLSI